MENLISGAKGVSAEKGLRLGKDLWKEINNSSSLHFTRTVFQGILRWLLVYMK